MKRFFIILLLFEGIVSYSQKIGSGILYVCYEKKDTLLHIYVNDLCLKSHPSYAYKRSSKRIFQKQNGIEQFIEFIKYFRIDIDTCIAGQTIYIFDKLSEKLTKNVKMLDIDNGYTICNHALVFTQQFFNNFKELKIIKYSDYKSREQKKIVFINDINLPTLEFFHLTIYKRKNLPEFPLEPFLNIKYLYFEYPNCYPFLGIGSKMIRSLRRFIEENPNLKAMEIPFNGRYLKKTAKERGIILNY